MKNFKLIKALINSVYFSLLFNFCMNDCFSMTGNADNRITKLKLHRTRGMSRLDTQYNQEPHGADNEFKFDGRINKIIDDEKCQKLNELGKFYCKENKTCMENPTDTFDEQIQECYNSNKQRVSFVNVDLFGKNIEEQKIINTLPKQEQPENSNINCPYYTPVKKEYIPRIDVCRDKKNDNNFDLNAPSSSSSSSNNSNNSNSSNDNSLNLNTLSNNSNYLDFLSYLNVQITNQQLATYQMNGVDFYGNDEDVRRISSIFPNIKNPQSERMFNDIIFDDISSDGYDQ